MSRPKYIFVHWFAFAVAAYHIYTYVAKYRNIFTTLYGKLLFQYCSLLTIIACRIANHKFLLTDKDAMMLVLLIGPTQTTANIFYSNAKVSVCGRAF